MYNTCRCAPLNKLCSFAYSRMESEEVDKRGNTTKQHQSEGLSCMRSQKNYMQLPLLYSTVAFWTCSICIHGHPSGQPSLHSLKAFFSCTHVTLLIKHVTALVGSALCINDPIQVFNHGHSSLHSCFSAHMVTIFHVPVM